jgi:hypothetical protein
VSSRRLALAATTSYQFGLCNLSSRLSLNSQSNFRTCICSLPSPSSLRWCFLCSKAGSYMDCLFSMFKSVNFSSFFSYPFLWFNLYGEVPLFAHIQHLQK